MAFRDFYQSVHNLADGLRKDNFTQTDIYWVIDVLDYVSEEAIKYITKLIDLTADGMLEKDDLGGFMEMTLSISRQSLMELLEKSQYLTNYAKEYIAENHKLTFEEIVYGVNAEKKDFMMKMCEIKRGEQPC